MRGFCRAGLSTAATAGADSPPVEQCGDMACYSPCGGILSHGAQCMCIMIAAASRASDSGRLKQPDCNLPMSFSIVLCPIYFFNLVLRCSFFFPSSFSSSSSRFQSRFVTFSPVSISAGRPSLSTSCNAACNKYLGTYIILLPGLFLLPSTRGLETCIGRSAKKIPLAA